MDEFEAANSAFFAFTRLEYIDDTVERLRPEIELLNPLEGTRRLQPLENQLFQHQQVSYQMTQQIQGFFLYFSYLFRQLTDLKLIIKSKPWKNWI